MEQFGGAKPAQYDAKRLRKSFLRRTVDYNSGLIMLSSLRQQFYPVSRKSPWPEIQPDLQFIFNLLPPSASQESSMNSCTTKFVHTSMNKYRSYVNVVRWTPEGRRLITGSASGEFTLWNGLTFNFETILQAHETSVRSMKWSRNDTWMLSGDNGGVVKYWQSNMNNLKVVQVHKDAVRGITFSPTDSKFATCSDDKTVKVWNFKEGQCEHTLTGHGWDVKCLDWHPYKGILASGSKDNLVKLWDPRAGKQVTTLHGHKNTIHAISWNKNGNWLLTGSRDQTIKIFEMRMMKEYATYKGHPKEVCSVSWHPHHEDLFASGGSDGSVLWWNVDCTLPISQILNAHSANIWTLDWHPLGHILCTGSNDCATRFWARQRPGESEFAKETVELEVDEKEEFYIPGFGTIDDDDEDERIKKRKKY